MTPVEREQRRGAQQFPGISSRAPEDFDAYVDALVASFAPISPAGPDRVAEILGLAPISPFVREQAR